MRSVLGWMRRRLGRLGATPARSRKRQGHVPSVLDPLERRQVLSTATITPFGAMPVQYAAIAPSTAAVTPGAYPTAASPAPSVMTAVAPTSTAVPSPSPTPTTATPAYYYGQPLVQAATVVQAPVVTPIPTPTWVSSVAPVGYAGQPIVGASATGISTINVETDYVQALYRTVLNRVGQPNEVAAWVGEMNGGMPTTQVALGFVNSLEHRQDEVDSYYEEFLHRTPETMANIWVQDMLAGASEQSVVEGILDSPEYQAAHQAPAQFIEGLYTDVLGHPADASGFAAWESTLASGVSRPQVVADFVNSPEAIDQVLETFYVDYLHRQPDLASSSAWATVLESPGGSDGQVAVGLLASPEFVQDSQQA